MKIVKQLSVLTLLSTMSLAKSMSGLLCYCTDPAVFREAEEVTPERPEVTITGEDGKKILRRLTILKTTGEIYSDGEVSWSLRELMYKALNWKQLKETLASSVSIQDYGYLLAEMDTLFQLYPDQIYQLYPASDTSPKPITKMDLQEWLNNPSDHPRLDLVAKKVIASELVTQRKQSLSRP